MEEKERYEWNSPYDSAVRDNKNDDIINAIERLNEQDKRIKELQKQLAEKEKEIEKYRNANMIVLGVRSQGKKHLMQIKIKELQNQTAIAELEKLRKQLDCEDNYCYGDNNIVICINRTIFNNMIDQQIKSLKGEE